jgi:hypothetical protein
VSLEYILQEGPPKVKALQQDHTNCKTDPEPKDGKAMTNWHIKSDLLVDLIT